MVDPCVCADLHRVWACKITVENQDCNTGPLGCQAVVGHGPWAATQPWVCLKQNPVSCYCLMLYRFHHVLATVKKETRLHPSFPVDNISSIAFIMYSLKQRKKFY